MGLKLTNIVLVGVPVRWRCKLADKYVKKYGSNMAKIGLAFKFGLHRRRPRMICEGFFTSFKITANIENNNVKAKYFLFSHISPSDFNLKLFLMYSKRLKNPQNVFFCENVSKKLEILLISHFLTL